MRNSTRWLDGGSSADVAYVVLARSRVVLILTGYTSLGRSVSTTGCGGSSMRAATASLGVRVLPKGSRKELQQANGLPSGAARLRSGGETLTSAEQRVLSVLGVSQDKVLQCHDGRRMNRLGISPRDFVGAANG